MNPTVIPENDSVDSSITTGSLPFEFLPVDSAISCSIQLESPGVVEFLSQKFITWSDKENRLAAILIAGESIKERDGLNFSASSRSKEISTPIRAAGTKPNADRALNRPPTFGSALTTLYPSFRAMTSSGVPGSVTITICSVGFRFACLNLLT